MSDEVRRFRAGEAGHMALWWSIFLLAIGVAALAGGDRPAERWAGAFLLVAGGFLLGGVRRSWTVVVGPSEVVFRTVVRSRVVPLDGVECACAVEGRFWRFGEHPHGSKRRYLVLHLRSGDIVRFPGFRVGDTEALTPLDEAVTYINHLIALDRPA